MLLESEQIVRTCKACTRDLSYSMEIILVPYMIDYVCDE